jgi:hypothetical protein
LRCQRLKKNASDHSAADEDNEIVFVANAKMLTSWRESELGHALTRLVSIDVDLDRVRGFCSGRSMSAIRHGTNSAA